MDKFSNSRWSALPRSLKEVAVVDLPDRESRMSLAILQRRPSLVITWAATPLSRQPYCGSQQGSVKEGTTVPI